MAPPALSPGMFYQHGWQSWNVTAWRPEEAPLRFPQVPAHRLQSTDPAHLDDANPGGAGIGAIVSNDGSVKLLGSLGVDGWVTLENGELTASGPGPWFKAQGGSLAVFQDYARALSDSLGSRTSKSGRVWCSWYGLYSNISEENIQNCISSLGDLAFDVIQIDDGWQRCNGDWRPNQKFPAGMQRLASEINATGRKAGLWLAPFIVDPKSELFSRYPDWVLQDQSGEPVVAAHNWGPSFTLDVTRADVQSWLFDEMTRVVGWGYQYLKLDFLYAASLPGCYHQEMGREEAYRLVSEVIRDAIGEDTYLLACGAPVIPSVGIYDGIRVGPDVSENWDNVDRTLHLADRAGPGGADAITTTLGRFWLRELIDVDPDVAFFRSRFCMLSGRQKKMISDLAHICQFKANSDLPDWLLADERERLSTFLEEEPVIEQLDWYRFSIDGRTVDFKDVVSSRPW